MTIGNLYRVHSTAKEFRGFKNVDIDLFVVGRDRSIAPYADLIIGYAGMAANERRYAEDLLRIVHRGRRARAPRVISAGVQLDIDRAVREGRPVEYRRLECCRHRSRHALVCGSCGIKSMYRVVRADGRLSGMVNLARAKDAAWGLAERRVFLSEDRRAA